MSGKIFCQIRVNATAGQIADERVPVRMEVCPAVIRLEHQEDGSLTRHRGRGMDDNFGAGIELSVTPTM